MTNFAFSIPEDKPEQIKSGVLLIKKSLTNYNYWRRLKPGDNVFFAPISVPFRIYFGTVSGIGLCDGRSESGIIIYLDGLKIADDVNVKLYNLQVFADWSEIDDRSAEELRSTCSDVSGMTHSRHQDDIFPGILPNGYTFDISFSQKSDRFLKKVAREHNFGDTEIGIRIVIQKNGVMIGGPYSIRMHYGTMNQIKSIMYLDSL